MVTVNVAKYLNKRVVIAVCSVLTLLLVSNVVSFISLSNEAHWVDGFVQIYPYSDPVVVQEDASELIDKMETIGNNPSIIVRTFEAVNPVSLLYPSVGWGRDWQVSAFDEIWVNGTLIQKSGDNIIINRAIETSREWNTEWYDWVKNAIFPWQLDKIRYSIRNWGSFENLEVGWPSEAQRFENLDFVYVDVSTFHNPEYSAWGPISLGIIIGALSFTILLFLLKRPKPKKW